MGFGATLYALIRRTLGKTWGKSIVLVALTGWGQEEDRQKSQDAGFDHHLVKPADHGVLARLLGELHRAGRNTADARDA
ncbi:MAG: hypothetical protein DCC68_10670 [Planctomycetota bacterium]|nr:MAG: hypothetical protein DCC68_10670 [Planctomycetota bacterium]